MKLHRVTTAFMAAIALGSAGALGAQTAYADATAKCADGTYSRARTRQGACSGHDGVATWYGPRGAVATRVPDGTTAKCGDGTYSTAQHRQGACSTHDGVAQWYGPGVIERGQPVEPEPMRAPAREREVTPVEDSRGATALCRDGTYSRSQHRSGTCSYHGGVRRWLRQLPR